MIPAKYSREYSGIYSEHSGRMMNFHLVEGDPEFSLNDRVLWLVYLDDMYPVWVFSIDAIYTENGIPSKFDVKVKIGISWIKVMDIEVHYHPAFKVSAIEVMQAAFERVVEAYLIEGR